VTLTKMSGTCVGCGRKQAFDPASIEPGDHPCCERCLMPLVDFVVEGEEGKRARKP